MKVTASNANYFWELLLFTLILWTVENLQLTAGPSFEIWINIAGTKDHCVQSVLEILNPST